MGGVCDSLESCATEWERCWRMIRVARTFGRSGVKVWIFKGEILGHDPMATDRLMMEAQTSGVRPDPRR